MATTYQGRFKIRGGSQITINVNRDGKPFGQLWTWPTTRTEYHPWHAKPLGGKHEVFDKLADAKAYMERS